MKGIVKFSKAHLQPSFKTGLINLLNWKLRCSECHPEILDTGNRRSKQTMDNFKIKVDYMTGQEWNPGYLI